jgi:hypothetical protein
VPATYLLPASASAPHNVPVKTLLGYNSPDLEQPVLPVGMISLVLASKAPPDFHSLSFVFFALFPSRHKQVPTSIIISATTLIDSESHLTMP